MYNVVKCDKNGMTSEMYLSTLRNGANLHKTNSLTEVTTSLSQLMDGSGMFRSHNKITKFEQDLPNLINGSKMFYGAYFHDFSINLNNLQNGNQMFYGTDLTSFNSELPNLQIGSQMFQNSELLNFSKDLPSLENRTSYVLWVQKSSGTPRMFTVSS